MTCGVNINFKIIIMYSLKDKVAAITGGTSGIGLAMVKKYLEGGARVAIFDLDDPSEVVAELGDSVIGFQGNVTNNEDLKNFFTMINKEFGKIDVVIANAGNGATTFVEKESGETLDLMIDVHVKGAFYTIQKALPYMNDGTSIIITSSNSSVQGFPNLSAYSAAKAASASLAKTLSRDLKDRNIRVNAISPGFIDTPGHQKTGMSREFVHQAVVGQNLLDRPGRPEEIANVAAFLGSDESTFVLGVNLLVDGGQNVL